MTEKENNDVQLGIHVHGTILLQEARYQAFPQGTADQQVEIFDEILHTDVSQKGFRLLYSRRIRFSPSAFFEISVTYQSDVEFDDDAGKKKLGSTEKIEEWIKNNVVRITNTFYLPAKASHLIANTCESAGFAPLVTQPTYLFPNKK